jgi:hypothetical protein
VNGPSSSDTEASHHPRIMMGGARSPPEELAKGDQRGDSRIM